MLESVSRESSESLGDSGVIVFTVAQSERCCTAQEKQRAVCDVFVSAGVNLLVGTESGLMLLDRSGQGKVYPLISRRRFQQMEVLEGLNVLVTISGNL